MKTKKTTKLFEAHPIAEIFPMMGEVEMRELTASIAEHGLREPIILHEGKILDGRNRAIACAAAGVVPRFVEFEKLETDHRSVSEFVLDINLRRRHLTISQRAAAAAAALPFFEIEAKARQSTTQAAAPKVEPEESKKAPEPEEESIDGTPYHESYGVIRSDRFEMVPAWAVVDSEELLNDPDVLAVCGPMVYRDVVAGTKEAIEKLRGGGIDYITVAGRKVLADGEGDLLDNLLTTALEALEPEKASRRKGGKGKATTEAGKQFGVSAKSVELAAKVQTENPAGFERIKRGESTVSKELTKLETSKAKKAEKEAARDAAMTRVLEICGKDFYDAVQTGERLKRNSDLIAYAALSDDKMLAIRHLIIQGWDLKRAQNYQFVDICRTHRVSDLLARTAAQGGSYCFDVDGYRIEVSQIK